MMKRANNQIGHFMRRVDDKKAWFICAWALCRRELSVNDDEESEQSNRAFYETGG